MRSPRNRISPEVGSSAPTRHEKSVVFPAPLGPMIPKMSPGMTSKSMGARARRPPKRFEMPRTESTASAGIGYPLVRSEGGGAERRQPPCDAHEAARLVEHHENEEPAVDEEKRIAQRGDGEEFDLERTEDDRAEDRTDDGADSAEDGHQDNAQAQAKVEDRAGRDVLEVDRVEAPGEGC